MWFAGTHVRELTVQRRKVVTSSETGHESVVLPFDAGGSTTPRTAVVVRVRNDSSTDQVFSLRAGDVGLGTRVVAAHAEARLDFAADTWLLQSSGLTLGGPNSGWTLVNAEVSNVHGFVRGLVNLYILPAQQALTVRPLWLLCMLGAAVVLLLVQPPAAVSSGIRLLHRVVGAAALILLVAAASSDFVSPYLVVLAPRTFVLSITVLLLRRIATLFRPVIVAVKTSQRLGIAATGIVGGAFALSATGVLLSGFGGNYSGILHISKQYRVSSSVPRRAP